MGSDTGRSARVFLVGTGVVGSAVLAIAHGETRARLPGLELVGVANTRGAPALFADVLKFTGQA